MTRRNDSDTIVGRTAQTNAEDAGELAMTGRRALLTTVAGGLAGLAGCSGGGSEGASTTATTAATTASTSSTVASENVQGALDDARTDIEEALAALAAHDLVTEEGPNLALDHVQGFETEAVTDPAAAARERLSDVDGSGGTSGQVETLVALTRYLDAKADLYLQLIAAQISTVQFKRRFASDETTMSGAYRTIDEAVAFVERVPGRRERAATLLDAIGGGAPQVEGFDPGAERSELDVLGSVVTDLRLTIVGFRAYTGAFLTAGEASSSFQSGQFDRAEREFTDASEAMQRADEALGRATERDAEYHGGYIDLFGCQTADLAAAFDGFARSAQARQEGQKERAAELSTAAEARIAEMRGACLEE